ncbi:MAG: hypothetical protein IKV76_09775 [Clostridia bacterium]|nr:hypothetical protein [Clostridia bacterium]
MAENKRTAEFLNKVYQNAQMASDSITTVSQKVQDKNLLSDLQTQHQQYTAISSKATTELANANELPADSNIMQQAMTWGGIQLNTAFDKTPDHIAEMMIQGSTMGIIDMSRTLKQYNDIPQNIKALGYELITVEENNVQRMKSYLG